MVLNQWLEARSLADRLIMPFFVIAGSGERRPLTNMPGIFKLSVDTLLTQVAVLVDRGLSTVMLFECHDKKDETYADPEETFLASAIEAVKGSAPELTIIADLCVCSRTKTGQCRLSQNGDLDDNGTLEAMKKLAVQYAQAGAQIISPSAMLKSQTQVVRDVLNSHGMRDVMLMPAMKFASSYFGPARQAFAMKAGATTKKPYHIAMDDRKGALDWCLAERDDGADVLIIKPALHALDVILEAKELLQIPIVGFQPSGNYSMLHLAADGWGVDPKDLMVEQMTSIFRAGADKIVTYEALQAVNWPVS